LAATYEGPDPFYDAAEPGEVEQNGPCSNSDGAGGKQAAHEPRLAHLGAVWVKAKEAAGTIRLEAHHQYLGKRAVEIRVRRAEPEYM
jgi:hypothetical protein